MSKRPACCDSCIFSKDPWKKAPMLGEKYLWCRRYPPTNESGAKRFPIVKNTDWCGEYSEMDTTAPLPDRQ